VVDPPGKRNSFPSALKPKAPPPQAGRGASFRLGFRFTMPLSPATVTELTGVLVQVEKAGSVETGSMGVHAQPCL